MRMVHNNSKKEHEYGQKAILVLFTGLVLWSSSVFAQSADQFLRSGKESYEVGDYRNAIKDFDKVLQINPRDTSAYRYRGLSKLILRAYGASIQDFTALIEITPTDAEAYFVRAIAKGKMKDFRGEIADYNQVLKYDPDNTDAYFNRGSAKLQLKYFESAVLDFDKVIELNPDYAAAFANRGQARIASGEKDLGCNDLRKAGDMGFAGALPVIIKNCY